VWLAIFCIPLFALRDFRDSGLAYLAFLIVLRSGELISQVVAYAITKTKLKGKNWFFGYFEVLCGDIEEDNEYHKVS